MNEFLTILCVGGFFIVMGLVNVFAPDWVWSWQEDRNKSQGLVSERTPDWDRRTRFQGYAILVFGIILTAILTCNSIIVAHL